MSARTLVVDDDPNIQRLLTYTLKQEGYEVIVASDGAEGLKKWAAESPDLMLLDVMLPKMDGYQVAAKGRAHACYGAKGGGGTTTIAINTAIALHREIGRKVVLVDGNLQFGDHRVFLDLGLDRKSIVDVVTATTIDQDLLRSVLVKHDSGVDLLLAPPSPETAERVSAAQHPTSRILDDLRGP